MAESLWFQHDFDAHNHPKFKALIASRGVLGYGWWWILEEEIARADNRAIDFGREYVRKGLAATLYTDEDELWTFIKECVYVYHLLDEDSYANNLIRCPGLDERMKSFDDERQRKSDIARANALSRKDYSANRKPTLASTEAVRKTAEAPNIPPDANIDDVTKLVNLINSIREGREDNGKPVRPVNTFERSQVLKLWQGHGFAKMDYAINCVGKRGWFCTLNQLEGELRGENEKSYSNGQAPTPEPERPKKQMDMARVQKATEALKPFMDRDEGFPRAVWLELMAAYDTGDKSPPKEIRKYAEAHLRKPAPKVATEGAA